MKLSQEQQKVVESKSRKLLCIAPSGAGKTRTMISRIQHLIENCQVSPYDIAVCTFTRKAAGEIKDRLMKEIGTPATRITAGTMHGIALKYLQTYGELVGLKPGKITVYSNWEENYLLKDVAMELGYHDGRKWKNVKKGEVDAAFKVYYTNGEHVLGAWNKEKAKSSEIMNAFFASCHENNALTYGMILTKFLKLIPKISKFLTLQHIMCDEVQDNNPLQWQILNDLCQACNAAQFAIGDFRQCIFSFQGSDPEYLIRNQHLFDVYNLTDNYRSSANIVDAANQLIEHCGVSIGEPMNAIQGDNFHPVAYHPDFDSKMIADNIAYYREEFTEKMAVLARNHWMLEKLSSLLTEAGIKHEYIGKKSKLVRSEEFRIFHSFLKLIVNEFDNFSFVLIRQYLELSAQDYADIRWDSTVEYQSHFSAWKATPDKDSYTWQKWFKVAERTDMASAIDLMKDIDFGFETEAIFEFVYAWILDHYDGTIDGYLNWLATFDVSDEIKEDVEGLQLCTMHSAKGLEWPTVIVIGLNESIFPSKQSISKNDLEEERRLAYTAFTRAENQLILTSRPIEKDSDGQIKNPVSRFIKESLS